MVQPLDPLTPALPPRAPLRHRVPGQGRAPSYEGDDGETGRGRLPAGDPTGEPSPEPDRQDDAADAEPPPGDPPATDRSGDDDHLIDEYA